MNKLLFFMVAILTIVGCSENDELVEQPKHEKKGNTVSIIVDSPEGGIASRSGNLPGGSYSGEGTYEQGAEFTVAATANSKYHISYFRGGPISNQNAFNLSCTSNTITGSHSDHMEGEDHSYHVGFAKDSYSLTVSGGTGGNVSGGGDYEWGKTISITANPSSGYAFDKWEVTSGDATIANVSSASTTATLNSTNSTIAAKFKKSYSGFIIDKLIRYEKDSYGRDVYYLYIQASEPVQWEANIYTQGEYQSYEWDGSDDVLKKEDQIQLSCTITRGETKSNEEMFIPYEGNANGSVHTTRYLKNTSKITWEENEDYKIGKDEWSGFIDKYAPR